MMTRHRTFIAVLAAGATLVSACSDAAQLPVRDADDGAPAPGAYGLATGS